MKRFGVTALCLYAAVSFVFLTLASCSSRSSSGIFFEKLEETDIGAFTLEGEFKIKNIITGQYVVDLYIISPGIAKLATLENIFIINATGISTTTGVSLSYNDVGFIKID